MCNVLALFTYNYLLQLEINSEVALEVNIVFTTHLQPFKKHLLNIAETVHYRNVIKHILYLPRVA
jgi:hypothetical protein